MISEERLQSIRNRSLWRGYCRGEQTWYYGAITDVSSLRSALYGYSEKWVETDSIGQYSGRDDKNHQRMFEGDIVKVKNKDFYNVEVDANSGKFYYVDKENNVYIDMSCFLSEQVEVVSNVYINDFKK